MYVGLLTALIVCPNVQDAGADKILTVTLELLEWRSTKPRRTACPTAIPADAMATASLEVHVMPGTPFSVKAKMGKREFSLAGIVKAPIHEEVAATVNASLIEPGSITMLTTTIQAALKKQIILAVGRSQHDGMAFRVMFAKKKQ